MCKIIVAATPAAKKLVEKAAAQKTAELRARNTRKVEASWRCQLAKDTWGALASLKAA